jgi:hypothetical protein
MGLDLGATINGGAEWMGSSPLLRGLTANPVAVALMLTALAYIVFAVVWGAPQTWRQSCRAAVYFFGFAALLTFLHYYTLDREVRAGAGWERAREVVDAVHSGFGQDQPGTYRVAPGRYQEQGVGGGGGQALAESRGDGQAAARNGGDERALAEGGAPPPPRQDFGADRSAGRGFGAWIEPSFRIEEPKLTEEPCACEGGEELPPVVLPSARRRRLPAVAQSSEQ